MSTVEHSNSTIPQDCPRKIIVLKEVIESILWTLDDYGGHHTRQVFEHHSWSTNQAPRCDLPIQPQSHLSTTRKMELADRPDMGNIQHHARHPERPTLGYWEDS